jgi:exopolysaccharide production protein ExoZ
MKRSIVSLQALRGVAALLVLLFHFTITLESLAKINFLNGVFRFGNSGVEIFFVLSGFIISFTSHSLIDSGKVREYLLKRTTRVYPIYWVVVALFLVPAFFLSLHGTYEFSGSNLLATLLLLPNHQMINGVSWSLSYELYFYLLFAVLIVSRHFRWVMLVILIICLLRFLGLMENGTDSFGNFVFSQYVLLFFLGVGVFYLIRYEKLRPSARISLFGIAASSLAYFMFSQLFHGTYSATMFYGLMTALFIYFCIHFEGSKRMQIPAVLVLIGDASYVLYLFHLPVLNVLMKAIAKAADNTTLVAILSLCTLPLIIAVSVLIHLHVEKPMNSIIRNRLGFSAR